MKKTALAAFIVVSFIVYAIIEQSNVSGTNNQIAAVPTASPTVALATVTPSTSVHSPTSAPPRPTSIPATPTVVVSNHKFKDGQFTGDVADAYYGNVQVRVTFNNDKITDVKFLDYPQDRGHSIEINQYAMPILISEAISAQSANVDSVSGATATSGAFIQSLQSAINQAKV